MNQEVLCDVRWSGNTGIGRYSKELMVRAPRFGILPIELKRKFSLNNPLTPWILGREIKDSNASFFWSPSFMPPLTSKVPYIFTIHDLIHLHFHSKIHKTYYNEIIAPIARGAKKIITDSLYSKVEICERLRVPEKIVEVAYLGVDSSFSNYGVKYKIENPYVLYIGNRRKHKNLVRLITAFSYVSKRHPDLCFAISGFEDKILSELTRKLDIHKKMRYLGKISEQDLPSIYRGAVATMFPSLYEGFGLPIIESMSCGTPVLTSNIASMPEIAGECAEIVDPYDVLSIDNGIETVLTNISRRKFLIDEGVKRSSAFNWDSTAYTVWNSVIGGV